ncbi:MAG: hypothetical protein H6706_02550 [Myxococcales bacterium]|nr:hypothetical protein [Myxococcales bacterium]
MAFDWMDAPVVRDTAAFTDQHRRELMRRAGLLRRLGHGPEAVVTRCRQNLAWEFDMAGPAPFDEAGVRALVEAVFAR